MSKKVNLIAPPRVALKEVILGYQEQIAALKLEVQGYEKLDKQQVEAARKREDRMIQARREFNALRPYIQHVGNCGARSSSNPEDERCICGLSREWNKLEVLNPR